jgi:hypothetical protein
MSTFIAPPHNALSLCCRVLIHSPHAVHILLTPQLHLLHAFGISSTGTPAGCSVAAAAAMAVVARWWGPAQLSVVVGGHLLSTTQQQAQHQSAHVSAVIHMFR